MVRSCILDVVLSIPPTHTHTHTHEVKVFMTHCPSADLPGPPWYQLEIITNTPSPQLAAGSSSNSVGNFYTQRDHVHLCNHKTVSPKVFRQKGFMRHAFFSVNILLFASRTKSRTGWVCAYMACTLQWLHVVQIHIMATFNSSQREKPYKLA